MVSNPHNQFTVTRAFPETGMFPHPAWQPPPPPPLQRLRVGWRREISKIVCLIDKMANITAKILAKIKKWENWEQGWYKIRLPEAASGLNRILIISNLPACTVLISQISLIPLIANCFKNFLNIDKISQILNGRYGQDGSPPSITFYSDCLS